MGDNPGPKGLSRGCRVFCSRSMKPSDFSRYVVAWKLCASMAASDVTDTLELALMASGYRPNLRRISPGTTWPCSRANEPRRRKPVLITA
jgi:transposase InsO family protein